MKPPPPFRPHPLLAVLCGLALTLGARLPLSAQPLYWDLNGTLLGAGGTSLAGLWDSATPNWNTASDGSAATTTWVPGRIAVFSAGSDASDSCALTVSGTPAPGGIVVEEGTVSLSGAAVGVGTGTVTIHSGAKLSIPSTAFLTASAGANLNLDGGTFRNTVDASGVTFVSPNFTINVGAAGGIVETAGSGTNNAIYAGTIKGPGSTLTKTGSGEFRYQGAGLPDTTFAKLVVNQGLYRLGFAASTADERGFGAVPASTSADAISLLNGGAIGASFIATLHANRGLTLGAGGGAINTSAGTLTIPGVISGAGDLLKPTSGTLILQGANTYSGNTLITGGTLRTEHASALGTTDGYTEVATGAELRFDGAAITFACAEPIRIAGIGAGGGGAITIQNQASPTLSGPITLTDDAQITVSGTASGVFSHPNAITALANQNLTLQGGANASGTKAINGAISLGAGGLTKLQGGEWILGAANSYTGPTTISAGRLTLGSGGAIAGSSTISVASGASFDVSAVPGGFPLGAAQALMGAGTVVGDLLIAGTLAPGASVGTITGMNQTWLPNGTLEIEVNDALGTAGVDPGWDLLVLTGNLTVSANSGNPFTIKLVSLTGAVPGPAANFDPASHYAWRITTVGGNINNYDDNKFVVNTAGFANSFTGFFYVTRAGNSIFLVYQPSCLTTTFGHEVAGANMEMYFTNASGLRSALSLTNFNCSVTGTAYDLNDAVLATGFTVPLTPATLLPPGTVRLTLVATKLASGLAVVNALVKNLCDAGVSFDPIITTVEIQSGNRAQQRFEGLPAAEGFLFVRNGSPGLDRLDVDINGRVFTMTLTDGQEVSSDLRHAMLEGDDNVVILTGYGAVGSSALVTLTDTPTGREAPLEEIIRLTLATAADGLKLRWPETLEGWTPQHAAAPDGTWAALTTAPVAEGGQWTVAIRPTEGAHFYRLSAPADAARRARPGERSSTRAKLRGADETSHANPTTSTTHAPLRW